MRVNKDNKDISVLWSQPVTLRLSTAANLNILPSKVELKGGVTTEREREKTLNGTSLKARRQRFDNKKDKRLSINPLFPQRFILSQRL